MQAGTDDLGATFTDLRQSLRGYLRRRVPDPAQAEDLVQDVFVKALTSQRAGRRIDNLAGWLFAATRTTLADHYRSAPGAMETLDDQLPEREADDLQMHQELSQCLRAFVERLPPLYRDTLIATEFQGETMRALAQSQGVSVSAIKSRVSRGRAMLRDRLLACCDIEITDGIVSDYRKIGPFGCRDHCA